MRLVDADKMLEQIKPTTSKDSECSILIADAKALITNFINNTATVPIEQISDGYHTFEDLYEQRLMLSAALAKDNPKAWKSKKHEDGELPFGGGWFIVGFDTAKGPYTYHYQLKDYDLFDCKELPEAKHYDGHTSKDVSRLLYL